MLRHLLPLLVGVFVLVTAPRASVDTITITSHELAGRLGIQANVELVPHVLKGDAVIGFYLADKIITVRTAPPRCAKTRSLPDTSTATGTVCCAGKDAMMQHSIF